MPFAFRSTDPVWRETICRERLLVVDSTANWCRVTRVARDAVRNEWDLAKHDVAEVMASSWLSMGRQRREGLERVARAERQMSEVKKTRDCRLAKQLSVDERMLGAARA